MNRVQWQLDEKDIQRIIAEYLNAKYGLHLDADDVGLRVIEYPRRTIALVSMSLEQYEKTKS